MKKNTSLIVKVVITLIIVFLIYSAFTLQFNLNELRQKKEELSAQESQEKYETERLQNEYNKKFDDKYVADAAKNKLDYHNADDIIFYNDLPSD